MTNESIYTILSTAIAALLVGVAKLIVMLRASKAKSEAAASKLKIAEAAATQERDQSEYKMVFAEMQSLLAGVTSRLGCVEEQNVLVQQRLLECEMDRADCKRHVTDLESRLEAVERSTP